METRAWWRFDLDQNVNSRYSNHVQGNNDVSHVFELLRMVITAWVLVVGPDSKPRFGGETVLTFGDNMTAVLWIRKCRGEKEPRSGTLMRMLG